MAKGRAPKKCAKCSATRGLRWVADDQEWYCPPHFPGGKTAYKAASSIGGKNSGKVRREKKVAKLLHLKIEGNKASVLSCKIARYNHLADGVSPKDSRRHRLLDLLENAIYEYCTEDTGSVEKDEKVKIIMTSKLPDAIKLSKLVDLLGPVEAMKLVPLELERDPYTQQTLDGQKLLQGKGSEGETISKPPAMEIHEAEETSDVPDIALAAPPDDSVKVPSGPAPEAPPAVPLPKESPEERKARIARQAKELTDLYIVKVRGGFRSAQEIMDAFARALEEDIKFKDLQQRVLFPKSDTDMPEAMVSDVKRASA